MDNSDTCEEEIVTRIAMLMRTTKNLCEVFCKNSIRQDVEVDLFFT